MYFFQSTENSQDNVNFEIDLYTQISDLLYSCYQTIRKHAVMTSEKQTNKQTNKQKKKPCIHKYKKLKGTDHDFCWSGKPIYHLQKEGNIHIFQNKYQNLHKFVEIMKENRVFGEFHS